MKKFKLWRLIRLIAITAVMAALPFASAAFAEEAKPEAKAEAKAEKAEAKTERPDPSKVIVARINGEDITEEEVLMFIQSLGQQGQQAMMLYGSPQGRSMILNEILSVKLFALEGAKLKLDEQEDFKKALEDIKNRMLAQAAMQNLVKDIKVTDEEAKKFYDEHPEHFTQPEHIRARHILISDDVESKDKIAKIQADLKSGKDFGEIAKEISICPSAPRGGDLGEFQRGQMVKPFEDAAFALKNPGDISEPVKTQFGWHLIKLEEKHPAEKIPFEQVKAQVMQQLENEKAAAMLKARADELKKEYKAEIIESPHRRTGLEPDNKNKK